MRLGILVVGCLAPLPRVLLKPPVCGSHQDQCQQYQNCDAGVCAVHGVLERRIVTGFSGQRQTCV